MRPKAIKLLKENLGGNLFDISLSSTLLDMSPEGRETKAKNKLVGLHQNKKHLHSKGNLNKMKSQSTEWEKIFANDISNKEYPKYIQKGYQGGSVVQHLPSAQGMLPGL